MDEQPPPPDPQTPSPKAGKTGSSGALPTRLMTAGIEFAAVVGVLSLGGWWLDSRWGTSPWLLLTGLFIGTTGGLYKVWRLGKKYF